MMRLLIVFAACLVGTYVGYQADNLFGLSSPTGGFDVSYAVVAAVTAAVVLLALHIF